MIDFTLIYCSIGIGIVVSMLTSKNVIVTIKKEAGDESPLFFVKLFICAVMSWPVIIIFLITRFVKKVWEL